MSSQNEMDDTTLPPSEPKVPIENYLLKLKDNVKSMGISHLLETWHKARYFNYAEPSRIYGLQRTTYRDCITGKKGLPKYVFNRLFCNDEKMMKKIFASVSYFKVGKYIVRLPKTANPQLAYLIGYLHGDGFIEPNQKRIAFFDVCKDQLKLVNRLIERIFKASGSIYKKKNERGYCIYVGRVAINSFLSEVFCIERGARSAHEIPVQFFKNKELLKWYMCGLFDAESAMPLKPKKKRDVYIDIAMKDTKLIKKLISSANPQDGQEIYGL